MSEEPSAAGTSQQGMHRRSDRVAGLVVAALGAAVLLYVRTFPELPGGQPGPALFPGIVGASLVVFGLAITVRSLRAPATGDAAAARAAATTTGRINALAVLGMIVGYLLLVETLGFELTMGVLLFLLMWRLGARPLVAAGAAVLTTGLLVLLFRQVLLVPLPTGLLGW